MAFGIGNCQNSEQSEKAVTKYYKASVADANVFFPILRQQPDRYPLLLQAWPKEAGPWVA